MRILCVRSGVYRSKYQQKAMLPNGWPKDIVYLNASKYSPKVQKAQLEAIRSPQESLPKGLVLSLPFKPSSLVCIQSIQDPKHPAFGQHGLFASKDLAPDSFIVAYLGLTHSNDTEDTNASSDYDLSLDREAGVSVDAMAMGTEARFINDYRGVREKGPNAEFRDIWLDVEDGVGEKAIGVFVLSAGKAGKWKDGIKKGEEIAVSYGKGFWQGRATDGAV